MLTIKKQNRAALFIALLLMMIVVVVPAVQAEEQTPVLVGAEISNKGDVSITFDQAVVIPDGIQDQFTVTLDGNPAKVSGVDKTNTVGKIKLVLDAKAASGQAFIIDYVKSDDPALQLVTTGGIAVESFTYNSSADATEDLTPPVLTADSMENLVGNTIDIEFASNLDWSSKITNIKVDDTSIREKYTVSDGKISINAEVFSAEKDYEIVIKATGYPDAALTQPVIAAASETEPEPESDPEITAAALNDIDGHWAQANVEQLVALGAVSGYPDGSFAPEKKISRAEFASILVAAFKLEGSQENLFADTVDHWAKGAIEAAYANDIISGYSEDQFGPDDNITREQMAVMIAKAVKLNAVNGEVNFTDIADISEWAKSWVVTAVENSLMSGYPDNTFKPQANASRAEAVTVIINALK